MKMMMAASVAALLAAVPALAAEPPLPDLVSEGTLGNLDVWSMPEGQPRIGTVYTSKDLPGIMIIGQAFDLNGAIMGPTALEIPVPPGEDAEAPAEMPLSAPVTGLEGITGPMGLEAVPEVELSETEQAALDNLVTILDGNTSPEEMQQRLLDWRAEWRPQLEADGSSTVLPQVQDAPAAPAASGEPRSMPPAYPANPGAAQPLDRLQDLAGTGAPPAAAPQEAAPQDVPAAPAPAPEEEPAAVTAPAAPAVSEASPADPAQAEAAAANDPQAILGALWNDIEDETLWFSVGRPDAQRTAYMFMDPECPYCARSIDAMKGAVDSGEIQLRMIPVPLVSPYSRDSIAEMLTAPDPVAEVFAHARGKLVGDRTPPAATFADLPEAFRGLVAHNVEIVRRHGIPGVPLFVFRKADGSIGLHSGQGSLDDLREAAALPPAFSVAAEAAVARAMENEAEKSPAPEAAPAPEPAPAASAPGTP